MTRLLVRTERRYSDGTVLVVNDEDEWPGSAADAHRFRLSQLRSCGADVSVVDGAIVRRHTPVVVDGVSWETTSTIRFVDEVTPDA